MSTGNSRRIRAAVIVSAVVALTYATSSCDIAECPSKIEQARELAIQGIQLGREWNWLEARKKLLQAVELYEQCGPADKHVLTLAAAGVADHYLADYGQAIERFTTASDIADSFETGGCTPDGKLMAFEADLLFTLGNPHEALEIYHAAFRECRSDRLFQTYINSRVAMTYEFLGDHERARAIVESWLEFEERVWGADSIDAAGALSGLASIDVSLGLLDSASLKLECADRIFGSLDEARPGRSTDAVRSFLNSRLDEHEQALEHQAHAVERMERYTGRRHPKVANRLVGVGLILSELGDFESASELQEEALGVLQEHFGEQHPDLGRAWWSICAVEHRQRLYTEAIRHCERAASIYEHEQLDTIPAYAVVKHELGGALCEHDRWEEGLDHLRTALSLCEGFVGPLHNWCQDIKGKIDSCWAEQQAALPTAENTAD